MAKTKKKGVKRKFSSKRSEVKNPWFRKREGLMSKDLGWGGVPITWQGSLMVFLLLAINFFSVFYFNLASGTADSVIKFLTVLSLSILVFALISIKKTKGVKNDF